MSSARDRLISGGELLQMPDVGPCELIDGRIVQMSPANPDHGRIEGNVSRIVEGFVRARGLGKVLVGEGGMARRGSWMSRLS
jgi:hypothetical protein